MSEPKSTSVPLDEPIARGDTSISTVTVRKPNAGELRGLKLSALMSADVDEHMKVLPRVTQPNLSTPELEAMDPSDFAVLVGTVVGFFMSKSQMAAVQKTLTS